MEGATWGSVAFFGGLEMCVYIALAAIVISLAVSFVVRGFFNPVDHYDWKNDAENF